MELITKRLKLRNLKKSDAKDIKENIDNVKISEFLLVVPYPYSIKDANWFINECKKKSRKKPQESYTFGITFKSENKIIGVISLEKVNKFAGTADIGYWLGEKYWRQGIMTEAFNAVLKFAFINLKLRRIDIFAFAENKASNSLIKKMGFKYEGSRRQKSRDRAIGKIHDDNLYGLLREDYKK